MLDSVPLELIRLSCSSNWNRFRCSKRDCEDLIGLMSSSVFEIKMMIETVIGDRIKKVYDEPGSFTLVYGGESLEACLLFDMSDAFTPAMVRIWFDSEKWVTSTPAFKPKPKHTTYGGGLVMTNVVLSDSGKMTICNVGIFPKEEAAVDTCGQKGAEL